MTTYKYNYIASGSYGCVISPSHSCEGKPETNTQNISKLFNEIELFKDEVIIQTYIQEQIDPTGNFTVKMINSCSSKNKDFLPKIKDFNKCELINERTPIIYQINYEYGGIDLSVLVEEHFRIIDKTVLKSFINIFKGISVLNAKSIIHHDIRLNNIVYDIIKKKFSLIDFGLMTTGDKIYDSNILLNETHKYFLTYLTFPPEYSFIYNALYNNNNPINVNSINTYKFIDELENYFKEINQLLKKCNKQNKVYLKKIIEIKKLLIDVVKISTTVTLFISDINDKENYFINLLKKDDKIKQKIDVYMLGLTLYYFIYLTIYNKIKSNISIDIPIKIFDLIKKMVDINPFTRISIEEATTEYEQLFA